jgi:hypothetical protein
MAVAVLALFIAMAGTGYAAVKLPANSVGTKQLKANAVVSSKIKNGSLSVKDFAAGQIPPGPTGPPGTAGPQGPQGPQGAQGEAGEIFLIAPDLVRRDQTLFITAGTENELTLPCNPDEGVVSGGYAGANANVLILDDNPAAGGLNVPTGWHVRARNNNPGDYAFTVYVVCAS